MTGSGPLPKIPRGVPPLNPRRIFRREALLQFVVPRIAALWIRATRALTRIRYHNRRVIEQMTREGTPYIVAFWHGQLFLMPYAYPGRGIAILISEHRDGELISRTMERFGFVTARGSSTRGGAAGLREIVRKMRTGLDAAFTPDGPRGPRQVVQPGVIAAARLSGAPIIPVAFSCSKKNSSGAGTGSWFPFPWAGACFSTAIPSS